MDAAGASPLDVLPAELLLGVALWLPNPADTQRLLCQTSRAVRQRVEGHLGAFQAAWLLHHRPATALTCAACCGDAPLLLALLAVPGERPDKDEALSAAAAAGLGGMAALEVLLAAGAVPQAGLLAAAGAGVREAVRALMAAGADPFADSGAAVRAACAGQHDGVLRDMVGYQSCYLYFHNGAYLPFLCAPLVAAARAGDWPAAEALLRSGHGSGVWHPVGSGRIGRETQIGFGAEAAADWGHVDVALRLVAAARSEQGQYEAHKRALTAAAFRGRVLAMQQLMEGRALSGSHLRTVLREACRGGSVEAVRVLRAAGAEVDGLTVRAAAGPYEGGAVAVLHVLLDSGATDPRTWNGALSLAIATKQWSMAQALLAACRGRGVLDLERALRGAVKEKEELDNGIVRALLQDGARVEVLGPGELRRYAGQTDNATRQVLQAAGVDFGGVDAAAAAAAAAQGAGGKGQGAV